MDPQMATACNQRQTKFTVSGHGASEGIKPTHEPRKVERERVRERATCVRIHSRMCTFCLSFPFAASAYGVETRDQDEEDEWGKVMQAKQTHRLQTHRHTDTDKQPYSDTQTHTHTDTQTHTHTETQTVACKRLELTLHRSVAISASFHFGKNVGEACWEGSSPFPLLVGLPALDFGRELLDKKKKRKATSPRC